MFKVPRPGFHLRPAGPEPSSRGKTKPNKATWVKPNGVNAIAPFWKKRSQTAYLAYFQWVVRQNAPETGARGRNDVSSMNCDTFWQCNGYKRARGRKVSGARSRVRGSKVGGRGSRADSAAPEVESREARDERRESTLGSRIPNPKPRVPRLQLAPAIGVVA